MTRGRPPGRRAVLEVAGLVLLLGTTLLQAMGHLGAGEQGLAYDAFLVAECALVWIGSALLHWKRSFFAANAAIIAGVCIWVAGPIEALRAININGLWLIFASGCILIGLAIAMERCRERIPLWIDAVRLRLETWT